MRNILLLGLGAGLFGLTGCNNAPKVFPYQAVNLVVGQAVYDYCGTVVWKEEALTWYDEDTLGNGIQVILWNGNDSKNAILKDRSIILTQNYNYSIQNSSGSSLPNLDSTFICTRTGEQIKSQVRLDGYGADYNYIHIWVYGNLD